MYLQTITTLLDILYKQAKKKRRKKILSTGLLILVYLLSLQHTLTCFGHHFQRAILKWVVRFYFKGCFTVDATVHTQAS